MNGEANVLQDWIEVVALQRRLQEHHGAVFFEAPTGFGKTGMLLETDLEQALINQLQGFLLGRPVPAGQLTHDRAASRPPFPRAAR